MGKSSRPSVRSKPVNDSITGRTRGSWLPYLFGAITGISIGLAILFVVVITRGTDSGKPSLLVPSQAQTVSFGEGISAQRNNAIVAATQLVRPAVVSIQAKGTRRMYRRYWLRWYGVDVPTMNSGSGFIVTEDGYIFTNYHVVANATQIYVALSNGETVAAELVGRASGHDLALLKIDRTGLPFAPLGDSDDVYVGEWAIAIGSPFGGALVDVQPTVTVGVISALHREIKQAEDAEQTFKDMIQTDAAINPGNSGGPLVNAEGRIIGVNTVIIDAGTGANVGLGFAIPINRAQYVFNEIVTYGRVRDLWIGMEAADITPAIQASLDLPASSGVLVQAIEDDGPADKAGIRAGDQLLTIDNVPLRSVRQANRIMTLARVGDVLSITLNRRDELVKVEIKLEERPNI